MPFYEYQARDRHRSCSHCAHRFEVMQRIADQPLTHCPECGASVRKVFSAPAVGRSESNFDDRAKSAGFHKLQRLGQGEYEKKY